MSLPTPAPYDRLTIRAAGAHDSAVLCPYGCHVLGWYGADGRDRFMVSRNADFIPGKPIRGGIPVCFPQFGGKGPLPPHGIARLNPWAVTASAPDQLTLTLADNDATRAVWPVPFRIAMTVAVAPQTLHLRCQVDNPGAAPFSFTFAWHTYFAVGDIALTTVHGLAGTTFHDSLVQGPGAVAVETRESIAIAEEVDRIYANAPDRMSIADNGRRRTFVVAKQNLPDAVLWNPWIAKSRRMADFWPEEFRGMVCLETGAIMAPVTLPPGQTWQAATSFTVQDHG
jgi:glucose-6-phosphate 1-epimerase